MQQKVEQIEGLNIQVLHTILFTKSIKSMFGKLAADALGLSDIGSVISPADFNKVDSDDYVMHEEGERIFFLIKSKTDEYCFTNTAFIHVDGASAVSKKRDLYRKEYAHHQIHHVSMETAGTIDMDVEIKFSMGDKHYSIDVHKKHLEEVKDLYKTLVRIGTIQKENNIMLTYAQSSLNHATSAVGRATAPNSIEAEFKAINQYAFDWLRQAHKTYNVKDFSNVFEMFIKN